MALRGKVRQALERAAIGEPWDPSSLCSECAESPVQGCPSCCPLHVSLDAEYFCVLTSPCTSRALLGCLIHGVVPP